MKEIIYVYTTETLSKLSGRVGLDTICKGQSYSGITTIEEFLKEIMKLKN